MYNMSSDYKNIRAEVNRKVGYTENESIVLNKDYFDCVNIKGSTDNSGCSA